MIKYFIGSHDGPFKIDKDEIEKAEFVGIKKIKSEIKSGKRKFTQAFLEGFKRFCETRGL